MNCADIERRVALYAGGDTDEASARDIGRHLATCEGCRALLIEIRVQREAMAEWRTATPTLGDLDDVRNGVLAVIACGGARPGVLGRTRFAPSRFVAWGSAGLAAAALLVFAVWTTVSTPQDVGPARSAAAQPSRATSRTAAVATAPRTAVAVTAPRTSVAARRPVVVRPPSQAPTRAMSIAAAVDGSREGAVRRIEIQTADPNIRIIWLVPEIAPDPNRSGAAGR